MKLISWNVNRRVKNASEQARLLGEREPDIAALQNVMKTAVECYEKAFARQGLSYTMDTLRRGAEANPSGVFIASRFALQQLPYPPFSTLWPDGPRTEEQIIVSHWRRRTLFVTIEGSWGKIDLHNIHITAKENVKRTPTGPISHEFIKTDLLSGLYQALAVHAKRPRILCGSFNTPREEKRTGEIITWGYEKRKNGDYRLTGEEQDIIERRILQGLAEFDLPDAYRRFHGYENSGSQEELSWKGIHRYDHIFASETLSPKSIDYLHGIGKYKLSEYVPIEMVFEFRDGKLLDKN